MICPVCNGVGKVDNPRFYSKPCWDAYESGIPTRIRCRHCGGYGYIIGDICEIIPALQMAVNDRRGLTAMETKQILSILNDYNDDSTNKCKNKT